MTTGLRQRPGQAGYALIIVLWAMVLLALLTLHLEQAGRDETELALNLRQAASLQAEADGAIAVAAFHLLSPGADAWHAGGQPYVIDVGDDIFTRRIVVQVENQAGKIDINRASGPLLQALLAALGSDPAVAGSIAANIVAWRFPAGAGAATEAVTAPYRKAGRDYGPPGAAYESIDELGLVLGVTPQLLALMAPRVTVDYQGIPEAGLADPVVARAMQAAGLQMSTPANPAAGGLQVVDVTATAYGAGSTRFTREATLRLGRQQHGWMYILSWTTPGDVPGDADAGD